MGRARSWEAARGQGSEGHRRPVEGESGHLGQVPPEGQGGFGYTEVMVPFPERSWGARRSLWRGGLGEGLGRCVGAEEKGGGR